MKDPRNYNPRLVSRVNSAFADPRSVRVAPKVAIVKRRRKIGTTVRNENLTVDGQISKYGGIMSHADGKCTQLKPPICRA